LTAQAFGKDDIAESYRLLFRSLIIAVLISLILLLIYKPIGNLFFSILDGSEKVKSLANEYYSIRILAAPAVLCLFAFRGWFFGMQNAVVPMVLTIVVNILNILFSWYFVMKLGMSVEGVAIGTVIAQWMTLFLAIVILLYRHRLKLFGYWDIGILKAEELKRFMIVNRDMFIRNMGLILVFSFFTNHSSKLGDGYLAVNQILLELFYLMSYTIDGFAYASESLVGKYLGAANLQKTKLVIKKCLIYGLLLGFLISGIYMIWGENILSIFTTNKALIAEGNRYMIWCALVGVSGALAFIWDGVYSGATASVELRNSMFFAVVAFFLVFYLSSNAFPYKAIWFAMIAFMLARSGFQIVLYKKSILSRWSKSI
jgi:MATE family multidrug resistance protein